MRHARRLAPVVAMAVVVGCGSSGSSVGARGGLTPSGLTDVSDYGAVGDGRTDDTAALTAAVDANGAVFMPAGTYMVSTLVLPAHALIDAAPGAILRGLPSATSDPVLTVAAGVRIDGLEVDGNGAARGSGAPCVSAPSGSPGVTLEAVSIHDCAGDGASFADSDDFVVDASQLARVGAACIDVGFSNGGRIASNTLDTCKHGIQWWGGDSAVTATIGVSDLTITGNQVTNVAGGCIWGSDGQRVSVFGNIATNCGDVGIDFEGTHQSTATGNTVTNATNAGLSTFYGSSEITFAGNIVDQTAAAGPGVNLFGTLPSQTIIIADNVIDAGSGYGIAMDQGIVTGLTVQANHITVTGSLAAIRALDAEAVTIVGNALTVAGATGISFEGPSSSLIADNAIATTGDTTTTPGDHGGIFMPWRSAAYPTQHDDVHGNTVTGFSTSINDDCWGDVASGNAITNNAVDGAIYRRAGAAWTGVVSGNYVAGTPATAVDAQSY